MVSKFPPAAPIPGTTLLLGVSYQGQLPGYTFPVVTQTSMLSILNLV